MMLCDDCIKKDVCRLKETCSNLESSLNDQPLYEVFTIEVKCKHKHTESRIRNMPTMHEFSKNCVISVDE